MKHLRTFEGVGQKIGIQPGQHKIINKVFPGYNREKSEILAEAGNDTGETFLGAFLVQIGGKNGGVYRFDDGKLVKKVK